MRGGTRKHRQKPDFVTIFIVSSLILLGLVSLLSTYASAFDGTETELARFWERMDFTYFNQQVGNILLSLIIAIPLILVDYRAYKPFTKSIFFGLCLVLGLLLLVGESTRGILGWFQIGSRAFQPSELAKIALICVLSKFCSEAADKTGGLRRFSDVLIAVGYFAVPFLLVLRQPDFGTAMVLVVIFLAITLAAGISWRYIAIGAALVVAAVPFIYFFLLDNTQKERILVFLDPTRDPSGTGYNVARAKELISSGGFLGKGFFAPGTVAQSGYVPERQTDFIFSGIGEATGMLGCILLILAFFALLFRWLSIAAKAQDRFGRCLVIGSAAMIAAHVFENIGMNLGLMPVTGIPLPFISYGGSNMLASLLSVALVLSVQVHSLRKTPQRLP